MQSKVLKFHEKHDLPIGRMNDLRGNNILEGKLNDLCKVYEGAVLSRDKRIALILEEVHELAVALNGGTRESAADAIGDILYTVFGAAVQYGVDAEKAFDAVHKSNMTKGSADKDDAEYKGDDYDEPEHD